MAPTIVAQPQTRQQIEDDVLRAMSLRTEEAFALLWPAEQPAPDALRALQKSVRAAFICAKGAAHLMRSSGDRSLMRIIRRGEVDLMRLACDYADKDLAKLWPSEQPMPRALKIVQEAVFDLLRYITKSERGKAQARARLLRRWTGDATAPNITPFGKPVVSDLTRYSTAVEVVPGLMAVLAGIASDLEPDGYVEAVDAWLAGQ